MKQDVSIYPINCKCGYSYEGYQVERIESTPIQGEVKVVEMFSPKDFQVPVTRKRFNQLFFTCPKCREISSVEF